MRWARKFWVAPNEPQLGKAVGAQILSGGKWASIGDAMGALNLIGGNVASIGGQIAICPPIGVGLLR